MHMYIYATTRDYHMILQLRDAVFPVVDEAQLNQATERERDRKKILKQQKSANNMKIFTFDFNSWNMQIK